MAATALYLGTVFGLCGLLHLATEVRARNQIIAKQAHDIAMAMDAFQKVMQANALLQRAYDLDRSIYQQREARMHHAMHHLLTPSNN